MSGTRSPDTLPNSLAWARRAACAGLDLDLFFSEAEWNVTEAKRYCGACPVREQCLSEGMRAEHAGTRFGIYGGLTPEERTELVGEKPKTGRPAGKRRPRAYLTPCGTTAAYRRHQRYDEEPCLACRAANAERLRKQAKRKADREARTTGTTKAPT